MTQATTPTLNTGRRPLNTEVVVRCSDLTKTFRDFWLRNRVRAVDKVNLDIRRGEVFGLLGPNGSGKSTTIKMILGLLHPTSGRVSVFGKRPDDVATKKLIGYLPEESYLYRFLNARETLEYYARLFHQSRAQSQRRIDMLLEMVGLESAQRRPVGEYSKGMQRRIGLAQALINDPQLLILDEPTTGLDPIGTKQIKDLIIELANRGKTILLCSHLLSDVEDVCDRVSIMFGGKVRAHGTCDELLTQHSSTTLQTPALDDATIQEIEQVLARRGLSIDKVEHPRQKLEQLFLDIVHKAQNEGLTTSGARAGGKIAGFLMEGEERGSHMPENVEAHAIVEKLVTGAAATPTPATPPTPEARQEQAVRDAQRKASEAQQNVLESLIAPKPAPTAKPPVEEASRVAKAPPPQPAADLNLINELVGQRTAPTPERVKPEPTPVTPPKAPPVASSAGQHDEERPDSSFLEAIDKVPPYDESQDANKKNA